VLQLAISV